MILQTATTPNIRCQASLLATFIEYLVCKLAKEKKSFKYFCQFFLNPTLLLMAKLKIVADLTPEQIFRSFLSLLKVHFTLIPHFYYFFNYSNFLTV